MKKSKIKDEVSQLMAGKKEFIFTNINAAKEMTEHLEKIEITYYVDLYGSYDQKSGGHMKDGFLNIEIADVIKMNSIIRKEKIEKLNTL